MGINALRVYNCVCLIGRLVKLENMRMGMVVQRHHVRLDPFLDIEHTPKNVCM